MTVLMAIDPGPHIGVAVGLDGTYITSTMLDVSKLYVFISEYKPDKLAVETFFTGNRTDAHMLHTIEQVGGIRAACTVLGIECYGQVPQARLSFVDEAESILRGHYGGRLDKSKQGHDHEISALAHLLCMEYRIRKGTLRDQGVYQRVRV